MGGGGSRGVAERSRTMISSVTVKIRHTHPFIINRLFYCFDMQMQGIYAIHPPLFCIVVCCKELSIHSMQKETNEEISKGNFISYSPGAIRSHKDVKSSEVYNTI